MKIEPPLCVDLDGTLIRGDCLYAAMAWQLRHQPVKFFTTLMVYFTQGRAAYKKAAGRGDGF